MRYFIETLADLDLEYPEVGEDKLRELATAKKKLMSKSVLRVQDDLALPAGGICFEFDATIYVHG